MLGPTLRALAPMENSDLLGNQTASHYSKRFITVMPKMATKEQNKVDAALKCKVHNRFKSLFTKAEASTFIDNEGPSWPPQSVELGSQTASQIVPS